MKLWSTLLLIGLLSSFALPKSKLSNMYYFCFSHPVKPKEGVGKQQILLTNIKKVTAEESYTKVLARQWQQIADKQCHSNSGCTSDLNYYFDEQSASDQLNKIKSRYSDTARFQIIEMPF